MSLANWINLKYHEKLHDNAHIMCCRERNPGTEHGTRLQANRIMSSPLNI